MHSLKAPLLLLPLLALARARSFSAPYISQAHSASRQIYTASPLRTSEITASVFSESHPVHESLFGSLRDIIAEDAELQPFAHPRVVVGPQQWDNILSMYASEDNFHKDGSYSKFFRTLSIGIGPHSKFIRDLAELERTGVTSVYQGLPYAETEAYQTYRASLQELADRIMMSSATHSDSFPICALWGSVALKQQSQNLTPFIDPQDTLDTCIKATVAWAKIVLAHRSFHCNPDCPKSGPNYADLWDTDKWFSLHHNWFLGGTGIALTYDLLYDHITEDDRTLMRSAVALFVMNRWSWGSSEQTTTKSPNAKTHPHRIFSNWAGYNSNLYLANLAIEGESGFDTYTSAVLQANGATGFNAGLHDRYSALLEQYMLHSFYPDGSTFEDGYSYFTAFREGSLALVASQRRGSNILGSARFRNIIHNAAQMHEPWQCGSLIGHASGGGILYNSWAALFRYSFPRGELPGMIWRQRFGDFRNNNPCRIQWTQAVLQLAFLGGEHNSDAGAPEFLDSSIQQHFKPSYYAPRRGLLIARASLSQDATYMHFDARPDSFFLGHDNADRGVFTFTALQQTWLDDLPWKQNAESRKHSLMHINGLAQGVKAPSAKMFKVLDVGAVVIAAADLTYAYNTQWANGDGQGRPPVRRMTMYDEDGTPRKELVTFRNKEISSPWELGWPSDDQAKDIGFSQGMSLSEAPDIGFSGLWMWKRAYRITPLRHMVRSSVLVRSGKSAIGYGVIVDSVAADPGMHVFESYLILHSSVFVDEDESSCTASRCRIVLSAGKPEKVDIHVVGMGADLSYKTESFDGSHKRLIVKSVREEAEELWIILHPHRGTPGRLIVKAESNGRHTIDYMGDTMTFAVNPDNHSVQAVKDQVNPSPMQSPTQSPAPSPTSNAIDTPTPTPAATPISSTSPVATASPSQIPDGSPPLPPNAPLGIPMPVINLNRKGSFSEAQMNAEPTTFYHPTDAPYQIVFRVRSKSYARRRLQDVFATCSRRTTVVTSLSLFDCGTGDTAKRLYGSRQCLFVGRSSTADSCRGSKTKYEKQLQAKKYYILVVSIYRRERTPYLLIRHGRTSI